ncbi:MAG TPA: VWA domain-containing protein [Pyrinomonadaceae bacterium]|nr:VWA domain-containing protein [Pyrinomonadaceae bacterium]
MNGKLLFGSSFRVLTSALLLAALLCLSVPGFRVAAQGDEGVRADLPLGGELKIENRRGDIFVEVWQEKHVSVSATVEGVTPRRSPVIIQRTEALLTIGVVRAVAGKTQRVDLHLRIPERSRVEIVTADGNIEVRGIPASLAAQTVAGDIRAEMPSGADASIRAETASGTIFSAIAAPDDVSSERVFEARSGRGTHPLLFKSERGSITLAPTDAEQSSSTVIRPPDTRPTPARVGNTESAQERRPPTLGSSGTSGSGAGTPGNTSDAPFEVDENDVVRIDTELVTVNMNVVDRSTNRGIVGLSQRDFKLFEDGIEQNISRFESSNAPFNLILLIDLSGSTREVVKLIREAALRFVDAARPMDSIGVVTFAGFPTVISRPTTDRRMLRARISAIDTVPFGDTKLYDATDFTMKEFMKEVNSQRRTAIVVMSDGLDGSLPSVRGDGSALAYEELLHRIQEFDGILYTLWLNTEYESLSDQDTQPEDFDRGHDRMKEIADVGGGLFYEVEKIEDLAGAYERVVADLGTVYSLSYRPTNKQRDGKWRAIRINVARSSAVARGKRGYYAN